ncbi:TauD/TfdA family dioxygenase [Phenylobacterium sp. LjRoot219]|uniref:TauD/TfdA dioxygenase family protein n=1 Tax=Phenylobacterium sp. LjRoot219 TaxID=3342283 RepID=UPI003ED128EE
MATTVAQPTFTRFSVEPLTPRIGAELHGIDLVRQLPDETIAEIRRALLTYKVIFFRDQDITQEQHIAFARRFGDLEVHPMTPADQPNPEVFHLKAGPQGGRGADMWHSDVTWREAPSLGSVLRGRIIPEVGGDTLFADMVAAYEGLSPAMKAWVSTLTAVHDGGVFATLQGRPVSDFHAKFPPQEHPVVRTHPETGEQALYVNVSFTTHIKGLSRRESAWLLEHLFAQAAIPEYQCRFRWRKNSVAFWDNRACQHYAAGDYFPAMREMERVTIVGNRPFFRAEG